MVRQQQLLLIGSTVVALGSADTCFSYNPDNKDVPHLVCPPAPGSATQNRLSLFFPGTGAAPSGLGLWGAHTSALGFHSLLLAYPNDGTVGSLCSGANVTKGCYRKVREARQYGGTVDYLFNSNSGKYDTTVAVEPADSADARLKLALASLDGAYPSGGWGQYLDAKTGGVAWSKVAVGGHSQGSGQALLVSKGELVERVLMFAGVDDVSTDGSGGYVAGDWVATPPSSGGTPANRIWGLGNVRGFCCPYWSTANWPALGMSGDPASYLSGSSHQLCSDEAVIGATASGKGMAGHNTVIYNDAIHAEAWTQMLMGSNTAAAAAAAAAAVGAKPTPAPALGACDCITPSPSPGSNSVSVAGALVGGAAVLALAVKGGQKFQLRYRESRRHASDWEYDPAAEAEAEAAAAARGNGNGNGNGVTAARVVAASSGREGAFAHESAAGGATNYVAEVTTAAAVVNAI
jgi:hypothetical protein